MVQLLSTRVNEPQNTWDVALPRVEVAYKTSTNVATGVGPNEIYMGWLPPIFR